MVRFDRKIKIGSQRFIKLWGLDIIYLLHIDHCLNKIMVLLLIFSALNHTITHFNGWSRIHPFASSVWISRWKWWSFGIFYHSALRDSAPSEVSKLSLTAGTSSCTRHVPRPALHVATCRAFCAFTASWPPYLQRNGRDLTRCGLWLVTNYFRFHIWTFCRALDGFKW